MDPAELISLEQLTFHRSSLISMECQMREEEPELATAISDLLELADPSTLQPSTHYYKLHANLVKHNKHKQTGRHWIGLN